jgi:hypothetical protein
MPGHRIPPSPRTPLNRWTNRRVEPQFNTLTGATDAVQRVRAGGGTTLRVFRCEGLVFAPVFCTRGGLTLRVVENLPRQRVAELQAVNVKRADVEACFIGPPLQRAHAVARLKTKNRVLWIFGAPRQPNSHYRYGHELWVLGHAIPEPKPNGCLAVTDGARDACEVVDEACGIACKQRIVAEALADQPLLVLRAAMRHADPMAQLMAADEARALQQLARCVAPRAARGRRVSA